MAARDATQMMAGIRRNNEDSNLPADSNMNTHNEMASLTEEETAMFIQLVKLYKKQSPGSSEMQAAPESPEKQNLQNTFAG